LLFLLLEYALSADGVYHQHMANSSEQIYTPSELNREVRLHIEMGFPRILLEAEISNLSRPASGHLYFSLKDDRAQIRCALFRSAASRLPIRPENGMKVLARGRISLYEPRGDFQMIVDGLEDAGEGLLRRRFEELKQKLENEGLFDASKKQNLPAQPLQIGVLTSPGGAAIQDIVHVLKRRWPVAKVRLYPVLVQGNEAPAAIISALQAANAHHWAEVLIVGRGGGSLEDLAPFNDEGVARAVFASQIPVISAVGHETDFSICDFVADLRAPTPSVAAELATPDQDTLEKSFRQAQDRLQRTVRNRLERAMQGLDHLSHRFRQQHPATRLSQQKNQLDSLQAALIRNMNLRQLKQANAVETLSLRLQAHHPGPKIAEFSRRIVNARHTLNHLATTQLHQHRQSLSDLARTLNAVSPLETIGRGYAVVTSSLTNEVISSIKQAPVGHTITTQLSDGRIRSTVDSSDEETLISDPDKNQGDSD
jgi:exodeoxyribonuclease VII large subunit